MTHNEEKKAINPHRPRTIQKLELAMSYNVGVRKVIQLRCKKDQNQTPRNENHNV